MITAIRNEELLQVLKDRPEVFSDLKDSSWDDEQLAHYNKVMSNYMNLSQLDKDIWYLYNVVGYTKTANLMQCSKSYILKKHRKIKELLGI